ncbi:hypothetical protein DFH27DRAFT_604852 [Peziza echinospora]|nr:hypothetical protein DFH27DRAFT_604852 [Peziza echinospora]
MSTQMHTMPGVTVQVGTVKMTMEYVNPQTRGQQMSPPQDLNSTGELAIGGTGHFTEKVDVNKQVMQLIEQYSRDRRIVKKMSKEMKGVKKEVRQITSSTDSPLECHNHLQKIDELELQYTLKIDELELKYDQKIEDLEAKCNQRVDELQEKYMQRCDELEAKYHKTIEKLEAELARTTEGLDSKRDADIQNLRTEMIRRLQNSMIRNRHSTIEKFYDKTNYPILRFPSTFHEISMMDGNEVTRLLQALDQVGMLTAGEPPNARLNRFLKFIGLNSFMA